MRFATFFFCLTILSACSFPLAQSESAPSDKVVSKLFLQGVYDLSEKNSRTTLDRLIKEYPRSSEARTARNLLNKILTSSPHGKSPEAAEIDKLRKENQRLQEDLEKLRQLLINSEKRAS